MYQAFHKITLHYQLTPMKYISTNGTFIEELEVFLVLLFLINKKATTSSYYQLGCFFATQVPFTPGSSKLRPINDRTSYYNAGEALVWYLQLFTKTNRC